MVDRPSSPPSILASVPDGEVPCVRVETPTDHRRLKRRADRFLKGPIPFAWIRQHVQCATDRLLLVLRASVDMRRTADVKLSADLLRDAGITNRKTAYRAIERLETRGSLTVHRKRGRRPTIRLHEYGGNSKAATVK